MEILIENKTQFRRIAAGLSIKYQHDKNWKVMAPIHLTMGAALTFVQDCLDRGFVVKATTTSWSCYIRVEVI